MAIMAERGIPVAPAAQMTAPLMGDERPTVGTPLTNGFAPTGYEQEEAEQVPHGVTKQ
jgi:hypothetical protein